MVFYTCRGLRGSRTLNRRLLAMTRGDETEKELSRFRNRFTRTAPNDCSREAIEHRLRTGYRLRQRHCSARHGER